MPVFVKVNSDRFTWVRARIAGVPFTDSCRVSKLVPTEACQMLRCALVWVHPVTCLAPVITGWAPGAACQRTVYPLDPESSAVRRNGEDSRYAPSASWTTRSPDIESFWA